MSPNKDKRKPKKKGLDDPKEVYYNPKSGATKTPAGQQRRLVKPLRTFDPF